MSARSGGTPWLAALAGLIGLTGGLVGGLAGGLAGGVMSTMAQADDRPGTAAGSDACHRLFDPVLARQDAQGVAERLQGAEAARVCEWNQREFARLQATRWIAADADEQATAGRIERAQALLDGEGATSLRLAAWWRVNAVLGEIASVRHDWHEAAVQFGEGYRLAVDQLSPPDGLPPPHVEDLQRALFDRASEAMLLSGDLSSAIARSGAGTGILVSRGPKPHAVPLPVQFEFDRADLAPQGQEAATRLAAFVRKRALPTLEIIGHTDPKGEADYNRDLSQRRASTVARSIEAAFRAAGQAPPTITTRGRGEDCPAVLSDPARYTEPQRHALYRRVEIVLDPSASASRVVCGQSVGR